MTLMETARLRGNAGEFVGVIAVFVLYFHDASESAT